MKKSFYTFFAFLINAISGLIFTALLSRSLGVNARGELYELQVYSMFLSSLLFVTFSQPLYESFRGVGISLRFFAFLVVGWFLILSPSLLLDQSLTIFCMFLFQGMSLFFLELSKFNPVFFRFVLSSVAQPLLLLVSTVVFYWKFSGLEAAIDFIAVAFGVSSIFGFFANANMFLLDRVVSYKLFFERSLSVFWFRFLAIVNKSVDKFCFFYLFDSNVIGLLAVCYSMESLVAKFYYQIANFHMNRVSNHKDGSSYYISLSLMLVLTLLLGNAIVFLLGEKILSFIFGEEFFIASRYLVFIILASSIDGVANVLTQKWLLEKDYLIIYGRQVLTLVVLLLGAVITYVNSYDPVFMLICFLVSSFIKVGYTALIPLMYRRKKLYGNV